MKSRRPSADPKVSVTGRTIADHRKHKKCLKGADKWLFPMETITLEVTLPTEWLSDIDHAVDRFFPVIRDRDDFLVKGCQYVLACLEEEKEATTTAARATRKREKR
ncbi:MAG: hypothetical protein ABL888_21665 [Pirellulaceae bacterium]